MAGTILGIVWIIRYGLVIVGTGHATTWIVFCCEDLGFLDFFATPIPNLRELVDSWRFANGYRFH